MTEESVATLTPFLMFEGRAEEAVNFYLSVFESSELHSLTRYGPGEAGAEGSVAMAEFSLNGQKLMCIDSSVHHDFGFTPAISLFVNCRSDEEIELLFQALSQNAKVLMPLADHGFSRKFGWTNDRFGVSWQLNLP
jgi:predicted 3-demethylubiquinone-9 3-methyltransferase (glyoxalase superfamily)